MADSKISKKHHPTGSLVRRVLLISVLLLVIPLFLYSFYRYLEEYKQNLFDWENHLKVVAEERVYFVAEVIKMDQALLESASLSVEESESFCGGPLNVKQIYMGPSMERIPLPAGASERFVIASKSRDALVIGKRDSGTSATVIFFPYKTIVDDVETTPPVRLSLLDSSGKVLAENRKFKEPSQLLEIKKPISNTPFSLQLAIDEHDLQSLQLSSYYWHFAALVFFVGVIGGGAVYLLTRRMAKPLKHLVSTMERVSTGASHARYKPDSFGFEINELGMQFNETLDSVLQHEQEVQRERLAREKLAEELKIGHEIQTSLLPSHVPGLPRADIGTGYLAAKEVNGDFYDLFRLENGKILLAVCDTAGKGISACLFSLGLRSMLRSMASNSSDLAEIVRRTNDLYTLDAHESSMFSTLWVGIYDPDNHHLVYCTQGHPPAFLCRSGALQELWTGGIALGAQKMDVIPTKEMVLEKGDLLVLYTDGIIEAHDLDKQLYGKHRLSEFLLRKKRETAQQIADQIIEHVHHFCHGALQHDDMTLIVMRISD